MSELPVENSGIGFGWWRLLQLRRVVGWVLAACVALCVWTLEARFKGLEVLHIAVEDTPVTLYRPMGEAALPPVVVAHGFGGSRQMMDQIAVSIARQGFAVASIDFIGHGRHGGKLSPDITRIEGTTQQLVASVERVADAIAARDDTTGPVSYVGHSMATDVIIRAAQARNDVGGVVAISMYSTALSETHPHCLLVVSGAGEGHLRQAGLDAARLIDPNAAEGQTVTRDDIKRRTAVAPHVGHVGVLYSAETLDEVTTWLRDATGQGREAALDWTGLVAGVLLVALVLLAWPLASLFPRRRDAGTTVPRRTFWMCLVAPIPFVLVAAALPTLGIAGNAAFGTLALILGAWGLIQMLLLYRAGVQFARPDALGLLSYVVLGLAVFAFALDRYGAAFVPTGERLVVLAVLLLGTIPCMIADTALVHGAPLWRRITARLALLIALSGAIAMAPVQLGIAFTTVPVLLLFFVVYGTIARWIAHRRGAGGVAIGKGVALAWALAASTPLFSVL